MREVLSEVVSLKFLLITVLLGTVLSISANLLTPHVHRLLRLVRWKEQIFPWLAFAWLCAFFLPILFGIVAQLVFRVPATVIENSPYLLYPFAAAMWLLFLGCPFILDRNESAFVKFFAWLGFAVASMLLVMLVKEAVR